MEALHALYDAEGSAILLVVPGAEDYTGGMDEVRGESDQRGLDLGHEYHDNDGGGMEEGPNDGDVVDAELVGLPSTDDVIPTQEECDQAWDEGYSAAADGKPESDCPIMKGPLCIAWVKGWKSWHDENDEAPDLSEEE